MQKHDPTAWIRPIEPIVDLDWDEEPLCEHQRCDGETADWVVGWKKNRVLRAGLSIAKLACHRHAGKFCATRKIARPPGLLDW